MESSRAIVAKTRDFIAMAGEQAFFTGCRQSRFISQAVMHGDRRPFPVALITLDEEEIQTWARERGKNEDPAALARDDDVQTLTQAELDRANAKYAPVEQIKKFTILDHGLSSEAGELIPMLKVKRTVINERYSDVFDALYR